MFCARRTRFRRYRERLVPFSCIALPDSFSAKPRASGTMFSAPGIIFVGTVVVGSCFHVLRSQTHFRRHRGIWVIFLSIARLTSFSAVPRASGPVFVFCTPGLIFGGTEGVVSCFHLLHTRPRFRRRRRCRGRRDPFSCFARPNSISMVPRASSPVFMFCAPGLVFDGAEGVWSRFHFCALGLIFIVTEGVPSRFHVSRSRTCFQRYRGRRVPFSYFAPPDSF
jgi:hypothetical protein